MPKKVPPEDRRVPLNCLVAPATRKRIEKLTTKRRSQGQVVDAAVERFVKEKHDEQKARRS